MDYHAWKRSKDGVMWIARDGLAFRDNEERCHIFKEEPYNVRLSMLDDDVN